MVAIIRDNGLMIKNKVQENLFGLIKVVIKDNLEITNNMDKVSINGQTEMFIKACGFKVKWMDQDNFFGMMVEFIKVHIRMIINRVKGYISGQMEQFFREDGKMDCSMDKVSL